MCIHRQTGRYSINNEFLVYSNSKLDYLSGDRIGKGICVGKGKDGFDCNRSWGRGEWMTYLDKWPSGFCGVRSWGSQMPSWAFLHQSCGQQGNVAKYWEFSATKKTSQGGKFEALGLGELISASGLTFKSSLVWKRLLCLEPRSALNRLRPHAWRIWEPPQSRAPLQPNPAPSCPALSVSLETLSRFLSQRWSRNHRGKWG